MAVFAASLLWLLCPGWAATGISEEEKTAILDAHNTYRCMHGVPLFEWDDAAAASAQAHVDAGDFAVSDAMVGSEQCTENLAWGYPTMTVERAAEKWYEEIERTPDGAGLIPEYTRSCGYYSTLVWKASVRVGCGRGTRNDEGGDFTACYYCPAGNVAGGFTDNVLAPSQTAEQCADPYASDGGSDDDTDDGPSPSMTPAPCLSPSPSETGVSADWMTEILDAHNTYRCMHGVPLFEWDDAAAASAQAHVDAGDFELFSDAMVGSEECSELHAWSSEETAAEAAGRWYAEIENSPDGTGAVPEYSSSCKGYTTLIWKASVRLGCGRGPRNERGGDYTACYYCPAGNSAGGFTDNVFAASNTAEQCADPCASDGGSDDDTDDGPTPSPAPCADDDGQMIALASGAGLTVSGCADVLSLCEDAAYSSTVQATCPATCGSCLTPSPSPNPSPDDNDLDNENLDADSADKASSAALVVLLLIGVAAIAV